MIDRIVRAGESIRRSFLSNSSFCPSLTVRLLLSRSVILELSADKCVQHDKKLLTDVDTTGYLS
jgi:hypothetical protein